MRCSLTISGTSSSLTPAVPDGLGIDDDCRAVLALVEASGLVGADRAGEAGGFHRVLEAGVELALAVGGAGGARAAGFAEVGADEYVALEFRQSRDSLSGGCCFEFYASFRPLGWRVLGLPHRPQHFCDNR